MRILVIHAKSKGVIHGDAIRIEKILELLHRSGMQVADVRLPLVTRTNLSEYKGVKDTFLNILPPHKSRSLPLTLAHGNITRQIEFNVSLNYLIRSLRILKPDLLVAETSKTGWIATVAAKKLSIPCIIDVHGLAFAEAKGWKRKDWQQIMNLEKEAFQDCDHLIVVSKRMKEYLSNDFKIPDGKMTVAPNGSDAQQLTATFETPLKVVYAGVFSYWEKVTDFLEIAKQADQRAFQFYVAGTGPLKNQLLKKIKEETIPINYLGHIPRQNIYQLLQQMQIGIAPSTRDLARQVASPIKIFDYMASGLPVITPRIGDWGDIIASEDCGIALKEDTNERYLEALDLMASEPDWTRMSHNAVRIIEEKCSWDIALGPIVDAIECLCA